MDTLFAFPTSGTAFTNIKLKNVDNDAAHPPPRKVARHDSTSSPHQPRPVAAAGPRSIKVTLESSPRSIQTRMPALRKIVDDFIRGFLRTDNAAPCSSPYEEVYHACKVLVLVAHQSEDLAVHLERNIKSCCREIMKALKTSELNVDEWLANFNHSWNWWLHRLRVLQSTLIYLDLVYLLPNENALPIWDAGTQAFENTVLESPTVVERVTAAVKQWCANERAQKSTKEEKSRISSLIDCMTSLGRYEEFIEQPYIQFVSEFYDERSKKLSQSTPIEYFKTCIVDIAVEDRGGAGILREQTVFMSGTVALQKLILPHLKILSTGALGEIITKRDKSLFSELDKVVERLATSSETWKVSPSSALISHFQDDILQRVKGIVTDVEKDGEMVDCLLELKEFIDESLSSKWIDDAERHDKKYSYATVEAFEKGFASRKVKPAEMIARRIDSLMREGQKEASDADFFAKMKRVLTLYRFSPDKDVFRTFYTRALAKRMLLGRSASDDFEKEVIKTLSESYDSAFGDCAQMFKDIAISKDLINEYRKVKPGREERPDPGLSVMILQHSVWPVIRKVSKSKTGLEIQLPPEMEVALADYSSFYRERHANRQLAWAHYLGTASLLARFPSRNHEISVSLYQAVVLLLFNERDTWSVEEIHEEIQLGMPDLIPTIQSLAFGGRPVLKRTIAREGRRVNPSDQFSFNEGFIEPRKHKFHINTIQQNDTVEETQQTVKVIDQYRDASLDAAIVRIMKAQKTVKNQQLITETIEAVAKHFKPEVKAIKLRIDSLIDREFIARKDGTTDVFVYLA